MNRSRVALGFGAALVFLGISIAVMWLPDTLVESVLTVACVVFLVRSVFKRDAFCVGAWSFLLLATVCNLAIDAGWLW